MPKTDKPKTERLDALLVARGLSPDLEQARRTIWAGEVLVDDELVDQPGTRCPVAAEIRLRNGAKRYATRGGEKLEHAVLRFGIEVAGRCALDVGAAAGGCTDCLLAHGACTVYAVEVGRGQLAQRLRLDPRVVDWGGRDARTLRAEECDPRPSLAVVDVTFCSLADLLPGVLGMLETVEAVLLVKPMQEAAALGLGHVPDLPREMLDRVLAQCREQRIPVQAIAPSDPPGPGGALEFFLHVRAPGLEPEAAATAMETALAEGAALLTRRPRPGRSGRQRRENWAAFRRRHAR